MIEEKAPITFHLAELRRRLLFSLAALLIGTIVAYTYVEDIIAVISAPAGKLYFLNPAEVFFFLPANRRRYGLICDLAHPLL